MSRITDPSDTPVIDMLSKCLHDETISFHMPGHDRADLFPEWLKKNALKIDTTEFDLTDDLNSPSSAFLKASEKAASAFGAGYTYLVTTGASSGIRASLFSLATRGDLVIADRNSHISVLDSCRMFGLKAVFSNQKNMVDTIEANPQARLVLITRPDYYGYAGNISGIIDAASSKGMTVVVDEAHGTHFVFAPDIMPPSALSLGADVVINSAHKTLPALTQGAYLHLSRKYIKKNTLSIEDMRTALQAVSTTSPSFLIAASLDHARSFMQLQGPERSKRLFDNITKFTRSLEDEWQGSMYSPALENGVITKDPFRLTITPHLAGTCVREVMRSFRSKGIYEEFSDLTRVVLITKFSHERNDFISLEKALGSSMSCTDDHRIDLSKRMETLIHGSGNLVLDFTDQSKNDICQVPIGSSAGKICARACYLYPPGIPIVFPGQEITPEMAGTINSLVEAGMEVKGLRNGRYFDCIC